MVLEKMPEATDQTKSLYLAPVALKAGNLGSTLLQVVPQMFCFYSQEKRAPKPAYQIALKITG